MTLAVLGARAGCSAQHLSSLEHGGTGASRSLVAAIDAALGAEGALMALLPAAIAERMLAADSRAAERQRYDQEDVEPINRRGLLDVAAGAALTVAALGPAPAAAREVDPALPAHWTALLALLGQQDDMDGPQAVLALARRELRLIAEHRAVARGELRVELARVETRWAVHAAWLCEDSGDRPGRHRLLDRAVALAREADHPDLIAWARARQAQWSDPPRAIRLADAALRTPRASPHTRAFCATRAAQAHARIGDEPVAERLLATAHELTRRESPPAPLSRNRPHDAEHDVSYWEARCWGALAPAKAIGLYEAVLRSWPRGEERDRGLHQVRLALACAGAGEIDRARAEGRKALTIARRTKSATAARELKRLGAALAAA